MSATTFALVALRAQIRHAQSKNLDDFSLPYINSLIIMDFNEMSYGITEEFRHPASDRPVNQECLDHLLDASFSDLPALGNSGD